MLSHYVHHHEPSLSINTNYHPNSLTDDVSLLENLDREFQAKSLYFHSVLEVLSFIVNTTASHKNMTKLEVFTTSHSTPLVLYYTKLMCHMLITCHYQH